ncbi:MAG: hypothetical protein JJU45_11560 [Acidimicrobiia bacterium]|nr:hypothetical protein [Acidimicrobiia bacterium]
MDVDTVLACGTCFQVIGGSTTAITGAVAAGTAGIGVVVQRVRGRRGEVATSNDEVLAHAACEPRVPGVADQPVADPPERPTTGTDAASRVDGERRGGYAQLTLRR